METRDARLTRPAAVACRVRLPDLVRWLDTYLDVAAVADAQPNGLQVEGRAEVRRVATAVTAGEDAIRRAVDSGADAILVHHGLFWDRDPRPLVGPLRRRVKLLLDRDVSLLAYHLPLDRHRDVGNNALAARRLGLTDLAPFAEHGGAAIGWRGRFPQPVARKELADRLRLLYGRDPLALDGGPDPVRTLGIVSGAAADDAREAAALGLDAFVTGEPRERSWYDAGELGVSIFACGHHATERLGVQALGEVLAREHALDVSFVEVPNPV